MEILIAKENVEDYTELERLLIVAEGLRNGNIRKFVKEYNISHDTFYTWKKDLMAQIKMIWGDDKTGYKKLAAFEDKENEIKNLQSELKDIKKDLKSLHRELEQAKLEIFRYKILWSTVPEEFKDKIPLKHCKAAVIEEVENLQYINLEEACEALDIAVGTLRSWRRDMESKKKQ